MIEGHSYFLAFGVISNVYYVVYDYDSYALAFLLHLQRTYLQTVFLLRIVNYYVNQLESLGHLRPLFFAGPLSQPF